MNKIQITLVFILILTTLFKAQNNGITKNGLGASNAIYLDGINDFLAGSNNSSMNILGDITIETWVNLSSQPENWVRIIGKGDNGNRTYGMWYYHPGKELVFQQYGGGVELSATMSLNLKTWYHIAMVRLGSIGFIYLNGELVATKACNNGGMPRTSTEPLTIGYAGFGSFLNGTIDEVRVWNIARSQKEIVADMNVTIPINSPGLMAYYQFNESSGNSVADISGNSNNCNLTNGPNWQIPSTAPIKSGQKRNSDSKGSSESNNGTNQDNPSLPILKVSEKNASNQLPKTILVFDKAQSLNLGNTVSITKVEKIKVPGEKKPQIVPTILGNGRVIEKVNNIYTIKLNANTAQKLKDYTDGDENYFCMKAEDKTVVASKPRIMVIPKIIKQELFKDGDYQLNSFEKMIISSFKNKLEDNDYTTIGFESILKKVYEDRLINEGTKVDLKALILEASGSDFYVEFEPLESSDCNKTLDFKIRNYANGEDVASDIKILNTCGTPDEYKNFASAILNQGALNKINSQYASLVSQGRKVSANFTIKNGSSAEFGKEYKGIRLEEHIENCIQQYAFNGNYKPAGTVNNRMSFSEVSIPLLKEETGQNYSPNAFSLDILKYLKEQAGIECEKSVVGSNINITIK
jgi:hypothetical protein